MQTIIIVDDNPREREFMSQLVAGSFKIEMAANATEAMQLIDNEPEPFIISDIQMPGLNGIDFAQQLWQSTPEARIVFYSHHADEMYVRTLVNIIPPETVYGYVLKDNNDETLSKAITAVFTEHQCWVDPKVRPVQARTNRSDTSITDAEYEVLVDIALGMTDNMIAQRRFLSRRGVQNRLKSLYIKLGIEHEKIADSIDNEAMNMRTRGISVALRRGLLNVHELTNAEEEFQTWLVERPQ